MFAAFIVLYVPENSKRTSVSVDKVVFLLGNYIPIGSKVIVY